MNGANPYNPANPREPLLGRTPHEGADVAKPAWDDDGNLLIKTYYPMPESVDADSDPYAHLLGKQE